MSENNMSEHNTSRADTPTQGRKPPHAPDGGALAKFSEGATTYDDQLTTSDPRKAIDDLAATRGAKFNPEQRTQFFELEYPCHTPTEQRWFLMQATQVRGSEAGVVVVHINITARKLLEVGLGSSAV